MSAKTVLILQPKAAADPAVREVVKTADLDLRVLVSYSQAEATRLVRESVESGATRVIAGGGDGTLNLVASALVGDAQSKPTATLGVLPLGTANDFARGCGLPSDDLVECLRIAATREGRLIDVAKMNESYFINVASLGLGAEITATTPTALKSALGGAAYSLVGLLKVLKLTPYTGTLTVPGGESQAGSMLFAAVGNSHFAGGGFDVAPHAELDDGLLDLVMIRAEARQGLGNIAAELDDPMNPANRHVLYRRLPEFTIESDRSLHCNLDGEPVLETSLRFSVLPKHLAVAY